MSDEPVNVIEMEQGVLVCDVEPGVVVRRIYQAGPHQYKRGPDVRAVWRGRRGVIMNHPRVVNLRHAVPKLSPAGRDKVVVVHCDRSSEFGNPCRIRPGCDRDQAIEGFRVYLRKWPWLVLVIRAKLAGDVWLGCWCAPLPCHCDVVGAVADGEDP